MKITLKIKPFSANESHGGKKNGGLFSKKEKLKYENDLTLLLPPKHSASFPEPPFKIYYEFGFSSSGSDIDNPIKVLQDIIFDKYGFNDNLIYSSSQRKYVVPKGDEYIIVEIEHFAGEKRRTTEWIKQLFRGVK